jgi:hypothetical protein
MWYEYDVMVTSKSRSKGLLALFRYGHPIDHVVQDGIAAFINIKYILLGGQKSFLLQQIALKTVSIGIPKQKIWKTD